MKLRKLGLYGFLGWVLYEIVSKAIFIYFGKQIWNFCENCIVSHPFIFVLLTLATILALGFIIACLWFMYASIMGMGGADAD